MNDVKKVGVSKGKIGTVGSGSRYAVLYKRTEGIDRGRSRIGVSRKQELGKMVVTSWK